MLRPPPAGTIAPAFRCSVSIDTVTCVPRLGLIAGTSSSAWNSSGRIWSAHTPVAFTTLAARTSNGSPLASSTQRTPAARPSSSSRSVTGARFSRTAPKRSASPRIVSTSRTSSVWQS